MSARLYIDENLRGLARWLRFLGFDTALAQGEPDSELLAHARREGRLLLTRDRALASEGARFVEETKTREQLVQVVGELGWPPEELWFTRCVLCNIPLRELTRAEAGASAPPEQSRFWRCESCGRLYWQGSHWERTQRFLRDLRS